MWYRLCGRYIDTSIASAFSCSKKAIPTGTLVYEVLLLLGLIVGAIPAFAKNSYRRKNVSHNNLDSLGCISTRLLNHGPSGSVGMDVFGGHLQKGGKKGVGMRGVL